MTKTLFLVTIDEDEVNCNDLEDKEHWCFHAYHYAVIASSFGDAAHRVNERRKEAGCVLPKSYSVSPLNTKRPGPIELSGKDDAEGNDQDANTLFGLFDTANSVDITVS